MRIVCVIVLAGYWIITLINLGMCRRSDKQGIVLNFFNANSSKYVFEMASAERRLEVTFLIKAEDNRLRDFEVVITIEDRSLPVFVAQKVINALYPLKAATVVEVKEITS